MVTQEKIDTTTSISVSNKSIFDLTGIAYFTAMDNLYCSGNQLTSLDLSKNTALTNLECNQNLLTSLDLSKNTALDLLYCSSNQLTSLDLSKNRISRFSCDDNSENITVALDGSFDFTTLFGMDVIKVSNVKINGTATTKPEDGKLTGLKKDDIVTYTYDCDGYKSATFKLIVSAVEEVTFDQLQTLITNTNSQMADYRTAKTSASLNILDKKLDAAKEITAESSKEAIQEAYNNLQDAIAGLVDATATVTLTSNPENSGILTGDGRYAVGDEVKISSKAVDGYTFAGWYTGADLSETPNMETTAFTYTIKDGDTEILYTAKYTLNETRNLSITIGNGTVAYSYNKTTGTFTEDVENQSFSRGTYFTVTAQPATDYQFLYWVEKGTGKILSEKETYSFYLSDNVQLEACYKSTTATTYYVVFKDMNGKVLQSEDVIKGQAATAPSHGTFTGYTFTGWDKSFTNVIEDMVITALYSRETGFTVEATGGTIQNPKVAYDYGTLVTVLADEQKNNKYFSGWYVSDKLVSDQREYSFYVTENVTLTAKYEGAEVLKEQPMVRMTMGERSALDTTTGYQKVQMNVSWAVPEGYTMMGAGLVRTYDDTKNSDATLSLDTVDGTNIKKNMSKLTTAAGTYAYTLTMSNAVNRSLYARGYLIYKEDATGKISTVYTEINCSSKPAN